MDFSLGLTALTLTLILAAPAQAGEMRTSPSAVVELFTSQGCSSCPPADAALAALSRQSGVIALAYHVDYWDYIGWKDTFGDRENSKRQRDYAKIWGSGSVYTPQLVVNGRSGVIASRHEEVASALAGASLPLPVKLTLTDDMLDISIDGQVGLKESMVWLVTFLDRATVEIERGENAGKSMNYSQIVTGRQVLGMWEPAGGAHLKLPVSELLLGPSNGAAILVQQEQGGLPGPIIGAASFVR